MRNILIILWAALFLGVPTYFSRATDWDTPGGPARLAKPGPNGPFRNDPAQGVPKHAYSPFDNIGKPPPYQPAVGRDFLSGRVAVKLKAPEASLTKSVNGLPDVLALQQRFAAYGLANVEQVFPNAQPPASPSPALKGTLSPSVGEREGVRGASKPDLTRWLRATCATNLDVQELVKTLANDPDVELAEPDYIRRLAACGTSPLADGSDPRYAQQWHLAAAHVPEAWAYLKSQGLSPGGCRDIVVAVIDTGVDYNHPDLAANMWVNSREIAGNGRDDDGNGFVDDVHGCNVVGTHSGNPMDDHGHGTHVAGIIAMQANNGQGGVGVAYNVQIMAIKAAQYSGVLSTTDIAEGINYAVANGADIINMSFGGYAKSQVEEDALIVAFGQCVLVAAAGNDGKVNLPCPFGADMYPAAYNWVLGVMASKPGGGLAPFSNYDCIPHDTHEYELMAPGVDIWSTLPNNQYAAWDGTSMATPIVSGIAALLRTKWSDKDVYSSRFIMGQIAANAGSGANALVALTVAPIPELSYLEHWTFDTTNQAAINDNDGRVDAGETIDLAIVIRNHWGKASNVLVNLEAWADGAFQADPYVTWLTNAVDYGAIGAFNWDDNGLIYSNQIITGVRNPFRFQVATNCPNDHVIPFRVNMACRNGFDPADTTDYAFQSRFNLVVQRGRQLPKIITQDMVLTSDDLWLVPGQTLIQQGVTVTVAAGTQVQWGSPDPNNPYSTPTTSYIQVEGTFLSQGTCTNPVEFFPSPIVAWGANTYIKNISGRGTTRLSYTKIRNPQLGLYGMYELLTSIDHCYLDWDSGCWGIGSSAMSNSVVHKVTGGSCGNWSFSPGNLVSCLMDSSYLFTSWGIGVMKDNVFLQDNQNNRPLSWQIQGPSFTTEASAALDTRYAQNAFLSKLWDPNISHWMNISPYGQWNRNQYAGIVSNYWGTISTTLIDAGITDFNDDFNRGHVVYQPLLTVPAESTFPFVVDVRLATASSTNASIVGAELVTFTVTYNRDMNTNVPPQVTFGPDTPVTDYTVHPIGGGWHDPRTWMGIFNVNPITGDGYQLMRIAGGCAASDPWLVCGEDSGRFRFEIITSGAESMNLQATGGEGRVDLSWMQNDFDMMAGYQIYRSTNPSNNFIRINSTIIPTGIRTFTDTNVQPGTAYYYKFTVAKTDMSESDYSNLAQGIPLDTIPPVLTHAPVTSASPGMPLTVFADATDNVWVQGVTLYFRAMGVTNYTSRAMTHTTGNRYAATVEGSRLVSPGLEYYIEATDGVSTVRSGRPEYPWQITVVDRPVVTVATPNHGPASGGTAVTIAGSNFKTNATVTFGGTPGGSVVVLSANQITCVTAGHFPAAVDVAVTNPDSQSGTLLRGYTYESDVASLSLPNTGGSRLSIVQVPINAANVQGLAAASLTVTFNAGVLRGTTARTGSLTPGWNVAANTNTTGQIRLSMASSGGTSSGSGVLAYLEFEVLGSPGTTSPLGLSNVSLNDGAILIQTANGTFAVNLAYDLSGTVRYWNGGAGVPGVSCTLQGDRVFTGQSGTNGGFTVAGAEAGNYTLTPAKSDGVNGITAYDASLVLQHDAGLINLTGRAFTAGDVNKSGQVTAMDAFYILQAAVGLLTPPFPGAGVVWQFDPVSRSYPGLNANQSGQDFTTILLGDPSGNWASAGGSGLITPKDSQSVTVALRSLTTRSNEMQVWLLARATAAQIYSIDLELKHNPSYGLLGLRSGPFAAALALASNTNEAGVVRVALAGAVPVSGIGAVLVLTLPSGASNDLQIANTSINEAAVVVEVDVTGASFDIDTDADGQSDWSEIRAGTDPNDPKSLFAMRSVELKPDGSKALTWSSVPGKSYQVWSKADLTESAWQQVGGALTAVEASSSVVDQPASGAAKRYYRVQLVE